MTTTSSRSISAEFKKKIQQVSSKVIDAEKNAETQIKNILQKSERIRKEQIKRAQTLLSEARKMRADGISVQVEKVKKEIEEKAHLGLERILSSLQLPTHKDIEKLNRKIAALEKRLKDLDEDLFGHSNKKPN